MSSSGGRVARDTGSSGKRARRYLVSIGTWPLSGSDWGRMPPTRAVRIIREALDAGVNLIDTADSYGSGTTEVLVGMAIRGRRDQVVLATKCGIVFQSPRWRIDLRASYVRHALEQSLIRLDTDYVDLLQLHWPDNLWGSRTRPLVLTWASTRLARSR
jgi:aryl-alcohol dehydrogenase-like predicted oxidoreductase